TPRSATIPARITMKPPVGPASGMRLPPNRDTMNPAMVAVYKPCPGLAPEAVANAMARGNATTPTIRPATKLFTQQRPASSPDRYASTIASIVLPLKLPTVSVDGGQDMWLKL